MDSISDIPVPTIAILAYRYGTIKQDELKIVNELYRKSANSLSFDEILLDQGFATQYQIGLLKLIQDYLVIQKKGIEFGRIAVEKGITTKEDIDKALFAQKEAFKKEKLKKLIGDILVESNVITIKQRDQILELQKEIDKRSSVLVKNEEDSSLSEYEQKFLKIKNLDKDFAKKVVSKKFASIDDIEEAEQKQEKEFKSSNKITLLGDILVKQGVITKEQKEKILVEQKRLKPDTLISRVYIDVSDDNMEAHVLFEKDSKDKKGISLSDIKLKLAGSRIKNGVFADSLIQCYIDKNAHFFPVARGGFPLENNNRAIEYRFDAKTPGNEQFKKGQTLAEQKISGKGLLGKDVFGNEIERDAFKNKPSYLIRCGFGTKLSKDNKKAFAKKAGRPSLSIQNRLYMHPILNILEDADLRYGEIEEYADVTISGILTEAFPVKAGNLKANEIRGTKIDAHGDITVAFGITGAKIRCQGSIQAKYIKNSTIEAFGDVVVKHEVLDSDIRISGEFIGENARIISSSVCAKNSIKIGSVGSRVTEPCMLAAGRYDHIVGETERIDAEIEKIKKELDEKIEEKEKYSEKAERLFKKMVQLKLFHDITEKKKKKLEEKASEKIEQDKRTRALLEKLKDKMKKSVDSLKKLNIEKKQIDLRIKKAENRIKAIRPGIEKEVAELEKDKSILLTWISDKPGSPEIVIKAGASETTLIKGVFCEKRLKKDFKNIIVREVKSADKKEDFSLKIYKG